ncbi:DUF5719 family protein [Arthrobacter sunyaminii]|uniref:Large extracellular alpha-helical protein n=1 Tax=Arthrobacter sunyaminii TaxID=2816859 RepID=A0A975XLK3_9MICC|nr:DUF5719 family protein [Arthrobacter sunyaminii]MBO0896393.1 hypothetical protein [Arthrobacter sunyaminii]MBO0908098.1 hypothetical protein [Arthrobacter sunyaminii]QWQ37115.1 hypothetical protein KG104_04905 [Arthrobacter sunyaminii]
MSGKKESPDRRARKRAAGDAAAEAGSPVAAGAEPSKSGPLPAGRAEVRVRRQRRRRQAVTAGSAVLILAAATAVVAGSEAVESGNAGRSVEIAAADVPAGPLTAVCPEPLRLLSGAVAGTDPQFSPVSESATTSLSAVVLSGAGNPVPASSLLKADGMSVLKAIADGAPKEQPLAGVRSAGVLANENVTEATVLSAEPSGTLQATANAVVGFSAEDGDLAGLAAANCQAPGNDMWILGARTTVGATAVLRLTNPSESAATVDLELYGSKGRVEGTGTRGILVPPGATKAIVLAGLAANDPGLAVRVRSSGGPVTAMVQQSLLRGLTPGGVELIQPSAAASPQQVISGVRIQSPAATKALTAKRGYESAAPVLQVAVPGSTNGVVSVRILGKDGDVSLPGGGVFTVPAGSVGQLPLDSLPEGTYSVEVTADVSVVAGTVSSRGSKPDAPVDLAVAPSGERLGNEHLAVLPADITSVLSFAAPAGAAEVRLTGVARDGSLTEEQIVSVPEGSTVTIPAQSVGSGLAAVLISTTGEPVYGAQVLTGKDDGVSVLPLPKGNIGGTSVPVSLGY